jgi:pilus assembly protein CpaB
MARRNRALILLVFALASGALAAFLALRYMRQQTAPLTQQEAPRQQMVVAARALPVGSVVTAEDIKTISWTGGQLPPGYIGSPDQVVGRGLVTSLEPNEPILAGKLAAEGAGGGLQVLIDEGMRAISIGVDQVVGVSGFVLPNSRVDVLLTMAAAGGGNEQTTKIIMQDVKTLAAGTTIQQDKEGKPLAVPVITLLVSPEQAETLALASQQGRIQLALRNALDTASITTRGTRVSALMGNVAPTPGRRRSVPVRTGPPVPTPTTVEVYRGGPRSLEKF